MESGRAHTIRFNIYIVKKNNNNKNDFTKNKNKDLR